MIFFQRSKLLQGLLLIILSAFLFACDGESSSNSSSDSDEVEVGQSNQTIVTDEDGNQIITDDDAVISVDPDGNANIVEDASGNITITNNPDGGSTIETGDGDTIVTSPDGIISQFGSGGTIESNVINSEAE